MIKFEPYIEYKMDECYLTNAECLGVLVNKLNSFTSTDAEDSTDSQLDILAHLMFAKDYDRKCYFDSCNNRTVYQFGRNVSYGEERDGNAYKYSAVFKFENSDKGEIRLIIYKGYIEKEDVVYSHVFSWEESIELGLIDCTTYQDPVKIECDTEYDDWELK